MPVSGPSRRIYLYWLLLLLPTLAVGAAALYLLQREQLRLEERSAATEEARRAAVAARVRLVAENVELIAGDVDIGILDTLAEMPGEDLETLLREWERNNPLVRGTFIVTRAGGTIRHPTRTGSEEQRGFRNRLEAVLLGTRPWSAPAATAAPAQSSSLRRDAAEDVAFDQVQANVAKVQSARQEVKLLARNQSPSLADERERRATGLREQDEGLVAKKAATVQRGWTEGEVDGRRHLFGWTLAESDSFVRGLELETAALTARLSGALPVEVELREAYVVRDEKGRVMHQAGALASAGDPVASVALSSKLLPGWQVAGYLASPAEMNAPAQGFFLIGALLVGTFMAAIVTGGSLLLRQARRAEAEAAQKTSFVANVSHEFKTPLTTIRLYTELLEQGRVPEPAKSAEYLRTVGRETQRLARLVNNVLDFSRLEQGQKKYECAEFDLAAMIEALLEAHAPRLADAGLAVVRELPAERLRISTDRDAVEQIVLNLLDNACKYAGSGGEVTVRVTPRPGGGADVSVSDRGAGVPVEQRERIFEKFHRVDDALTAEKGGAGLGLSIARQLARGLGGDLRCEARAGGGSVFILNLP